MTEGTESYSLHAESEHAPSPAVHHALDGCGGGVGGAGQHAGVEMGVAVGAGRVAVAEEPAGHGQAFACEECVAGIGVAQIVEP
jgi:hypothetical protein